MKILLTGLFLSLSFLTYGQTPDTVAVRIEIDSLLQLTNNLLNEQKLEEALLVMLQAEEKCLAVFGEETALYASIVNNMGIINYDKGEYSIVESFWLKAKNIREKVLGKEHPDYALSLNDLANLYWDGSQYEKVEQMFLEAKAILDKTLGKEDPDYASTLNDLANLYSDMGQYGKAEQLYLEATSILEKALGKQHPDYSSTMNDLANLYSDIGQYRKAEETYVEAKAIQENAWGKEHPDYAFSLNNLALLYWDMGQYEMAEQLYVEAIVIQEKTLGKEHLDYASSLNGLANLYSDMGQYKKAEQLFLEDKAIQKKTLGKEHSDYASRLNDMANLYSGTGQYQKAEQMYLEAIAIQEKAWGKEGPDYAIGLNNLALLYWDMGQYEMAEQLYVEAIVIQEKTLGKEHLDYASSLNGLANLYSDTGKYEKAEQLYVEAIAIQETVLGKEHPDYASSLNDLANLYSNIGQYEKAERLFEEANEIERTMLINASHHLSERELVGYIDKFEHDQSRFLSFAQAHEKLLESAYDNSLFHKGFLLNASLQVNRLAKTDSTSTEMFYRIKGINRRLASEYSKPIAERESSIVAVLEGKANILEKELTRSVSGFGEALKQVRWQDVQAHLKEGNAAIEFVNFRFSNPEPTDSVLYAAMILKDSGPPKFISLFEEKSLDSLFLPHQEHRSDYVNDLYSFADRGLIVEGKAKKALYDIIWKPLVKELAGIEEIYYAPTGLLHRINLEAIAVDDEKTIGDVYQIVQLKSTRSLTSVNEELSQNNQASLYGGIHYEADSTAIAIANQNYSGEILASLSSNNFEGINTSIRGGSWSYLKGTQKEVESIHSILQKNNFISSLNVEFEATEESFRVLGQKNPSPRILHIATHGFFFPDPNDELNENSINDDDPVFKNSDNPMIRSGLILAGGNHVWQGNPTVENMEDGILTAYEISQMDLSNTELVVLSACETGLGDIAGNEGVYGLQRAFKIAGAKYLIMSLWQVPDKQTSMLMTSFYKKWLEGKMTIPNAFHAAQKQLRDFGFDPYQWAGFVLVE